MTPNTETQLLFNEPIKNNYTITFNSWYTERKIVTDGGEYQVDRASVQNINSPKCLIAGHRTQERVATASNDRIIAIFDHVDVTKYFVEIDGFRYPKEIVQINFSHNDYLDQYRKLKSFYREYVGEELLSPLIIFPDMKNNYPFQVIDLRHQIDHIGPKIQLFEKYKTDLVFANKRLYVILIRHRQIEMISDGEKLFEVKVIKF